MVPNGLLGNSPFAGSTYMYDIIFIDLYHFRLASMTNGLYIAVKETNIRTIIRIKYACIIVNAFSLYRTWIKLILESSMNALYEAYDLS